MELHVDCQKRLKEVLLEILPQALVRNGQFLDLSSLLGLQKAAEALPQQQKKLATEWISENPFPDFIYGLLSERLKSSSDFDQSSEPRRLVDFPEFSYIPALAESLLADFLSLPWRYTLFVPLPLQATAFTEGLVPADGFHLSPSLAIVQGRQLSGEGFPVRGENKRLGFASFLDRREGPPKWDADHFYLRADLQGFIADYFPTTPVENLSFAVRSFAGLGLSIGAFSLRGLYFSSLRGLYTPVSMSLEVYVYREPDPGGCYVLKKSQEISTEYGDKISNLQWYEQLNKVSVGEARIFLQDRLEHLAAAFEETLDREPLRRAGQWYFDSLCGASELLSFVQAMVSLEILFGDKATSDFMGLGHLLANRCAYLIGTSSRERDDILKKFAKIYDTRSEIVHRGKNRLSAKEREHLWVLRWMSRRAIQEELQLIIASKKETRGGGDGRHAEAYRQSKRKKHQAKKQTEAKK